MMFMDEATLLAHALRDYVRPIVNLRELKWIDLDLSAGEPVSAVKSGLALCEELEIALPPLFETKIMSLACLSDHDVAFLRTQFSALPTWWQKAS